MYLNGILEIAKEDGDFWNSSGWTGRVSKGRGGSGGSRMWPDTLTVSGGWKWDPGFGLAEGRAWVSGL